MSFANKVALVTGGGSGIGRATALALGKAGASVVIGNRNVEQGEAVVAEIREAGGQAVFQRTDVTQPEQVQALVERAVRDFGGLHVAFNNAGFEGEMGPMHTQSFESARKVFDINVHGVIYAMKFEIEQMLKHGAGAIVNNASVLGVKGLPNVSIYTASKHAVVGLTRAAALDYAKLGIRINAIGPGPVETRMINDMSGGDTSGFAGLVPMGRIGEPHEIASPVLWLLSDQASFITGTMLSADGGVGA